MGTKAQVRVERNKNVEIVTRSVTSWNAAREELLFFDSDMMFRGQRSAAWLVDCTLNRRRGGMDALAAERLVLEEFRARAHLFIDRGSEPNSTLDWLALAQHHGAPTRLIDFSRSPFVAAFFAIEEAGEDDTCAIWAVSSIECHELSVGAVSKSASEFEWLTSSHAMEPVFEAYWRQGLTTGFAAPVTGFRHNFRMAVQQGVFLCLGDPNRGLLANLSEAAGGRNLRLVKLEFPGSQRGKALADLRQMNVTRETLFPGLDGLAVSVGHLLAPRHLEHEILVHLLGRPRSWPYDSSESASEI